jgi:hypothetical protein
MFKGMVTSFPGDEKYYPRFSTTVYLKRRINTNLPFHLPPKVVQIENPNGVLCSQNIETCTISNGEPHQPCFKCREQNYICKNFTQPFTFKDIQIPANTNESEGYCIPDTNVDFNNINPNTSDLILTVDQFENVYFVVQCKYPNIFNHSVPTQDCSQFINPCGQFPLYNILTNENYVEGTKINFDPFVNGRCRVPPDSNYTATWPDTTGPGIRSLNFLEQNYTGTGYTNKTPTQELLDIGYRQDVIDLFKTRVNTIHLPTPCAFDPRNGNPVNGKWDPLYKACICGPGTVPAIEQQDSNGNVVDTQDGAPNACLGIGDSTTSENFIEYANVQPNSYPQLMKQVNTQILNAPTPIQVLFQRPAMWEPYTYFHREATDPGRVESDGFDFLLDPLSGWSFVYTDSRFAISRYRDTLDKMNGAFPSGTSYLNTLKTIMIDSGEPILGDINEAVVVNDFESGRLNLNRAEKFFTLKTIGERESLGAYTSPTLVINSYRWALETDGFLTNQYVFTIDYSNKFCLGKPVWYYQNTTITSELVQNLTQDEVDPNVLYDYPAV